MLIYDVETLTIAALNGAAVRQYGARIHPAIQRRGVRL